jgi:hypothetical protein
VLGSWRDDGYLIQLIDAGDRNADIICKPFAEAPRPCGKVTFDADQDRHFIDWNDLGKMVFEEYKRNFLDTKIYYAMAEAIR